MASYRHLVRQCLIKTIFSVEFRESVAQDTLNNILDEFAPKVTERDFAYSTLEGLLKNKDEIIKNIERYAPEWPFEKLPRIDRAILELGIYEILFSEEIPDIVSINECIELAKEFGDENSSKFINGVLSSVANSKK
ncbi:transcription antitermination factor NusB [Candidatus Peregrinibacteria bacterium HGW-Peregrinibacteria-1]|jgi:N utilization substance protein B|nr:MAG: transcription antitermination factor NusB [Candidatus Peregrinibacteria bacterium HGW-Peregrinibacteria-1]